MLTAVSLMKTIRTIGERLLDGMSVDELKTVSVPLLNELPQVDGGLSNGAG